MAKSRERIKPPKPWEILGAFFGYFAVAKDVPHILRTLGAIFPSIIKSLLRSLGLNSDTGLQWIFTIAVFAILFYCMPRTQEEEYPEKDDRLEQMERVFRRERWFQIIRSFWLIVLREKILDRMGVAMYGTFRRYSSWAPEPAREHHIDRINFIDGRGIEFQYSKGAYKFFVREHPNNSDVYGETQERTPTSAEVRLLMIASNFFPRWWISQKLRHCLF